MATDADAETVTYQFEMDADAWREWVETIPRSQPIHGRLAALIEQDYRAATRETEDGGMDDKMLGVFATRIRIRAMHALSAIRDDDDLEEAVSQLEELIDIADVLEG